jgi:filamentous hemagglutinin
MSSNGWQGAPIDVVRMSDETLIAVDNTRLAAARLTGTPVRATIRPFDEAFPVLRDPKNQFFSNLGTGERPGTWGEAVLNRMSRQQPLWIDRYPMGSPFTGVHPKSGSVIP